MYYTKPVEKNRQYDEWRKQNQHLLGSDGTHIRVVQEIQRQVNGLMEKGYEPHGEIGKTQYELHSSVFIYTQMMIKRPSAEVVYPTAKEL